MRPIEAGCRAVIVNSMAGNNGIVLTVLGSAPDDNNYFKEQTNNRWYIDKQIVSSKGKRSNTISEYLLQRIDDDDVELGSWDSETFKQLGWNPNKIAVHE